MANRMLIPLDGSDLAEAALAYAEAIGKALGWSAVLLHVVSPEIAHDRPTALRPPGGEEWVRPAGYEAIHELEVAAFDDEAGPAARLRASGLDVSREVASGDPKEVIAERAAEDDVAIIVMASHGRTGLARLFRGSVAASVAERTRCPLLIVRPFRDAESRVDLEHGERLAETEFEAVRQAIESVPT